MTSALAAERDCVVTAAELLCWPLPAAPVQESAFLKGAVACSSVSCTHICAQQHACLGTEETPTNLPRGLGTNGGRKDGTRSYQRYHSPKPTPPHS